jgi:hypothetical protein
MDQERDNCGLIEIECKCMEKRSFSDLERHLLLSTPGISHGVVSRIEAAGVCTIRELKDRGVEALVDQICRGVGSLAWRNRKRALSRALARLDWPDS